MEICFLFYYRCKKVQNMVCKGRQNTQIRQLLVPFSRCKNSNCIALSCWRLAQKLFYSGRHILLKLCFDRRERLPTSLWQIPMQFRSVAKSSPICRWLVADLARLVANLSPIFWRAYVVERLRIHHRQLAKTVADATVTLRRLIGDKYGENELHW